MRDSGIPEARRMRWLTDCPLGKDVFRIEFSEGFVSAVRRLCAGFQGKEKIPRLAAKCESLRLQVAGIVYRSDWNSQVIPQGVEFIHKKIRAVSQEEEKLVW